jgi:hypothetical protein
MRLHSQGLIQGGHLWRLAPVGAPSDPSPPPNRSKQAYDLARRKALTSQEDPALRAAGPGERTAGAFGQDGFDEVNGEHAGHLPRRQDQCGEGGGVFDCVQKALHSWIIMAYAVVQA